MMYKKRIDAVHAWVESFNAIPQGVVAKLMKLDWDDVNEITPPAIGDRVCLFRRDPPTGEYCGEITNTDGESYVILLDDGDSVTVRDDDFEVEYDDVLPMWGTMWSFGDSADNWWLDEDMSGVECGLQAMANCGFRIYTQEDFGYIFGIDGAGYDFYESHWEPLYKARGLKWSDEDK